MLSYGVVSLILGLAIFVQLRLVTDRHIYINCKVFCIDFCCFVIVFEWRADLTRKGNRSLNSENIVD